MFTVIQVVGSKDEVVKMIQKKLIVDGVFGEKTELAVKRFQGSKGRAVDGVAGPKTWGKLFK